MTGSNPLISNLKQSDKSENLLRSFKETLISCGYEAERAENHGQDLNCKTGQTSEKAEYILCQSQGSDSEGKGC